MTNILDLTEALERHGIDGEERRRIIAHNFLKSLIKVQESFVYLLSIGMKTNLTIKDIVLDMDLDAKKRIFGQRSFPYVNMLIEEF